MKLNKPIDDAFMMRDSKVIHDYIYGGEGRVILVGPSNTAHSYLFSLPKNVENFPEDVRFVYALHEGVPIYLGMIEDDYFRITRSSKYDPEGEIAKGAAYILKMSQNAELARRTPMRLYHLGVCGVCGLPLRSQKEIKSGIHTKCADKKAKNSNNEYYQSTIDDYFDTFVLQ